MSDEALTTDSLALQVSVESLFLFQVISHIKPGDFFSSCISIWLFFYLALLKVLLFFSLLWCSCHLMSKSQNLSYVILCFFKTSYDTFLKHNHTGTHAMASFASDHKKGEANGHTNIHALSGGVIWQELRWERLQTPGWTICWSYWTDR